MKKQQHFDDGNRRSAEIILEAPERYGRGLVDWANAWLLGGFLSAEPKATGSRGQLMGRTSSGGTHKEQPEQRQARQASLFEET